MTNSNIIKNIFTNSSIVFAVKVLGAGVAFLSNWLIARYLGVDEAGRYYLGIAVISFLATLGTLGMNNVVLKLISQNHKTDNWIQINAIMRTGTILMLIAGMILLLLMYIFNNFLASFFSIPNVAIIFILLAITVPLSSIQQMYSNALLATNKIIASTFASPLQSIVIIIFILFFGTSIENQANGASTAVDVSIYSIVAAFVALIFAIVYWFKQPQAKFVGKYDSYAILTLATPLLTAQLITQVNNQAGQIMLGHWAEAKDIAHYAIALKVAALTSFVFIAINQVVAPKFAQLHADQDMDQLKYVVKWSTRIMILFSLPLILFMLLFPKFILGFFGHDYVEAAPLLQILAIGQFINVATGSVGYLLIMTGQEKLYRNNIFITAVLALSTGIIFIPLYESLGAALMTFCTLSSSNLLSCYQVNKKLGINTLKLW